jgi:hypothetical protein
MVCKALYALSHYQPQQHLVSSFLHLHILVIEFKIISMSLCTHFILCAILFGPTPQCYPLHFSEHCIFCEALQPPSDGLIGAKPSL